MMSASGMSWVCGVPVFPQHTWNRTRSAGIPSSAPFKASTASGR